MTGTGEGASSWIQIWRSDVGGGQSAPLHTLPILSWKNWWMISLRDSDRAQQPDGYVNSHILTGRPPVVIDSKTLRDLHELYCAGHLIESAVVHHEATGKDTLLGVVRRYADLLFEALWQRVR